MGREALLVVWWAVAAYLALALFAYHPGDPGWSQTGTGAAVRNPAGRFGAWFADLSLYLFGHLAFLIPVLVAFAGWLVFRRDAAAGPADLRELGLRAVGFLALLFSGCGLGAFVAVRPGSLPLAEFGAGGLLGEWFGRRVMAAAFGELGAQLLLLTVFFASVSLFTGLSWLAVMDALGRWVLEGAAAAAGAVRRLAGAWRTWREARTARRRRDAGRGEVVEPPPVREPPRIEPVFQAPLASSREFEERQIPMFEPPPQQQRPPLSLLDPPAKGKGGYSKQALEAMSRLVEHKLADFGVSVQVVEVHPGPVITRFELQPAPGVKVSQISNLSKDLARSLSVVSVRVVEVIPGKTTVGLEVPNEERELVRLGEVLRCDDYEKAASPLVLALGKDIGGRPVVADLARMPHLLVAGTTGSGKSVAINAMLLSLLYKATPADVRLILIDPKMLELNVYEGIPHLLAPVVTDMKESANALRWCVAEMERRYKLMAALGVRNIAGYNRRLREAERRGETLPDPLFKADPADPDAGPPPLVHLPYIVVVVDEYADMMMVVGKKVEELIARLAQKARAAGIHLILATQRPSVDVITGLIKANIPCRIAFQVSSRVDSRTILDQMGAEQLLGHGDMLFLPPGTSVPVRVHGAFVDDHEVHRVVAHLKKTGAPDYLPEVLAGDGAEGDADGPAAADAEQDELYDQAVAIVTESRKASISYVQRRLKIGYNRAARMLEAMEAAGIVSPLQSNGMREVLAPPPPKS
ncbi:MAG: DNA translocase FtsK [Gammaproteobacteria bacterium]|nr:MAG: DNA translocase FtsK [Gammaproteobacteria bacterium]